jgi:putative drug exporter of the RND superfamily
VLEEVFVLGVGTDYSIFLVARYREELVRGKSSEEAVVTAVTWAGQAIATSGSTAILVTMALAFSGVALLSQWGMVLSAAILITMAVALTLLPALLRLIGPRLFWPVSGERFARSARAANRRAASGSTYFYRAARFSERRPGWVVGTVVLVSVPLVAVALQVPVSYNFYGQLPSGHSATEGLDQLAQTFGSGFAVPSYALVTFSAPLVVGTSANTAEFTDLAQLTALANSTDGIATVRSPVGPYGANLTAWESLASASPAERSALLATLSSYVSSVDNRTVLLQIQPSSPGLSLGAVRSVGEVEGAYTSFASGHPEVSALAFGGGAPVINDLAHETDLATEVMLLAVTVGLVLVLLAVLRSWIIAVMAVASIGLSISWAWSLSDLVLQQFLGIPIFFYVRTILIMLVLGLGIDYNIFLLTRVREERVKGQSASAATVEAVGRTGGIITAAAVILASAFAALLAGEFTLIRSIGFAVAVAVTLDAMVVRTYLVPASLQLLGERVWTLWGRRPKTSS